jgi:ABC-type histidine transport system ATPase subunit
MCSQQKSNEKIYVSVSYIFLKFNGFNSMTVLGQNIVKGAQRVLDVKFYHKN